MVTAPRRTRRGLIAALIALAVATLVFAAVGAAQPSTEPSTTTPSSSAAPTTSITPTTSGTPPTTTTSTTTTAAPTTTDSGSGGGDCSGHIRIPGTDWCTPIPNSVTSATGDAISSFFSDIVDQVLRGFIWLIKYAWQVFVHVDIDSTSSQSTLQKVNDMTGELQVVACGLGLLIALMQILFQRMMLSGDNAAPEAFAGFVRWALAATLAAPALLALAGASDALAEWLFTTAANQAGGTTHIVDQLSSALSGRDARLKTEDVISLALALLGLIAYLELTIQLVLQKAWLIYVAAGLPIAGAASVTGGGKAVFWSMVRLSVGVLLFKPIAALLFAVAFWQIRELNSGSDVVTAVLAMVAPAFCLPVLTRLVGNTAVAYSGAPMLAGTYRRTRSIGRAAGSIAGRSAGGRGDSSAEGESSRRDDKAKPQPTAPTPPTGTAGPGKAGPAPAPGHTGTNTSTSARSSNTTGTGTSTRGGATTGGTTTSGTANTTTGSSGGASSNSGSAAGTSRSGATQSGRATSSTGTARTNGSSNSPAAPPPTGGNATNAARSGGRSDPNSGAARASTEHTPGPTPTPARAERARRRSGPRDSSFRRIT